MDYAPTDGETFYSPKPPEDQVAEEQRAIDITLSALPFLDEVIADYQEAYDTAITIKGVEIGGGINTDAQILAKSQIAAFAKDRLDKYTNLRNSVQPTDEEVVS